jgi:tight adherence protein C
MRNVVTITALILIPVFILLTDDISWEKLSLKFLNRIGDRTNARSKLAEIGFSDERFYENFRYRQLILIFITISAELIISILLNATVSALFGFSLFSAVAIIFLSEHRLSRELSLHRDAIESDFPSIVEALTLSLSAGETPLASMQRISSGGSGPLAKEFAVVIESVTQGAPFVTALDSMGRRMSSVAVRRFIDSIVIAVTRGAPLIDVLHSHAQEARADQRNRVLSAASKSELSMMIPVVFLILPVSILFALWPSLSNLNLFAQG